MQGGCRPYSVPGLGMPRAGLGGMGHGLVDRQRQIAILERLVASERELLDDPRYGIAAARVMAQARHELATLRETAPRELRVTVATR